MISDKIQEIEEQTNLMSDLVGKQTEGLEEGLMLIYKFSLIYKIFKSMDMDSEESKGLEAMVDQIKGALLLEELDNK